MNNYDEFLSMLSEHSKEIFTKEEGCMYLQPMYDYFRHLKANRSPKVVGSNSDYIYRTHCKYCAATIEYVENDLVNIKRSWIRSVRVLKCPNCKNHINPDFLKKDGNYRMMYGRPVMLNPPPPPRPPAPTHKVPEPKKVN